MKILLLSDIHANYPALEAIDARHPGEPFDMIINCGDSLVYGPFPNQTLSWLKKNGAISILGNTDKKVIKLLQGKSFNKPSKHEKRIMYTWTAKQLDRANTEYLLSFKKKKIVEVAHGSNQEKSIIGIYHGSPERNHEFLFSTTPDSRFYELAHHVPHCDIVVCGHSHSPFHKLIGSTHFINPGSVGRMFDGSPDASYAIITLHNSSTVVNHYRIHYNIEQTVRKLHHHELPEIYGLMFQQGMKLN